MSQSLKGTGVKQLKEDFSHDVKAVKKKTKKVKTKRTKTERCSLPKYDCSSISKNFTVKCSPNTKIKKRKRKKSFEQFNVQALKDHPMSFKINDRVLSSLPKRKTFPTSKQAVSRSTSRKSPRSVENTSTAKMVSKFDVEMLDISAEVSSCNSIKLALIYVVIDTNVFLGEDGLKAIRSLVDWHPLPGKIFLRATVVVPWVVLQELDHLKAKGSTGSKARKAINFLNKNFSKKSGIRGQSILEAATVIEGLKVEINDDRLLQCCFFFCSLPGKHKTVLFSKDSNLCNKAMINHFETFSTFSSLVKYITSVCKSDKVQFDNKQRFISVKEHRCSSPITSLCMNDDNENIADTTELSESEILTEVKDCLRDSLSLILEKELIAAFGKEIWKDVVKRKPPWTLLDILFCMKKHWFPVFGMADYDKIILNLIEDINERLDHNSSLSSAGGSVESFINTNIELLRNLRVHHKKEEILDDSLKAMQTYVEKRKRLSTSRATGSVQDANNSSSAEGYLKGESSYVANDVSFDEVFNSNDHEFLEEHCMIFWNCIDKVWTAIIEHCALIISSLNLIPKLNEIPSELQTLLASPLSNRIPGSAEAIQVIPLLVELISSFLNSLKSFISSYEAEASPSMSNCFDLTQTLWTISGAFQLNNDLSNVQPSDVRAACSPSHRRESLVTGFNKLNSVFEILRQCASYARVVT